MRPNCQRTPGIVLFWILMAGAVFLYSLTRPAWTTGQCPPPVERAARPARAVPLAPAARFH